MTGDKMLLPKVNPCYHWRGVECSTVEVVNPATQSAMHITGIKLNHMNMSGTLPTEIGNFAFLETLNLDNNEIYGRIPGTIGKLPNLIHLSMKNNKLRSVLPVSLGNLTKLKSLNLQHNKLLGFLPKTLGSMVNLESLYLNDNLNLRGTIPTEMMELKHLDYGYLQNNHFEGDVPFSVEPFPQSPKVANFNLKYINVTSNTAMGCSYHNLRTRVGKNVNKGIEMYDKVSGSKIGVQTLIESDSSAECKYW